MNHKQAMADLTLFTENIIRLNSTRFVQGLLANPGGVSIKFDTDTPLTVTFRGPGQDDVEAIAATWRFFVQDNDRISLRRIHKIMLDLHTEEIIVDQTWIDWCDARKSINDYLDSTGTIAFDLDLTDEDGASLVKGNVDRRFVMETILYGELVHANEKKEKILKHWHNAGVYGFFRNSFDKTLVDLSLTLESVRTGIIDSTLEAISSHK